jgi:hypothetical protein
MCSLTLPQLFGYTARHFMPTDDMFVAFYKSTQLYGVCIPCRGCAHFIEIFSVTRFDALHLTGAGAPATNVLPLRG